MRRLVLVVLGGAAVLAGCSWLPHAVTSPPRSYSPVALPQCRHRDLAASYGGGGAALGSIAAVIRFVDVRRPCRLSGWPGLVGVTSDGRRSTNPWRDDSSASVGGGRRIASPPEVRLERGKVADVVVDGTDIPPNGREFCPRFRVFVIRLPGIAHPYVLPARSPNYQPYFPDCARLARTPVVPQSWIIPKQRRGPN
jgi:hypothetical protein